MKKIILFTILALIGILIYIFIDYNIYININVVNNIVDINSTHKVSEFVDKIINAKLLNGESEVSFTNLGEVQVPVKLINNYGKLYNYDIIVNVVDNEKPVIECGDIDTYIYEEIDFLDHVKISDNSNEQIEPKVVGNYNLYKKGTYKLSYFATDSSGNTSECSFNLNVKDKIAMADIASNQYYLKLNKKLNVLMVYSLDTSGNYNNLVKTFVVSAGNNTPVGTFKIKERHNYISFAGGSWGRYGIRINGPYWFHSVPYNKLSKNGHWDSISSKEYNKLGTLASHGCVRLSVADVKWLYENIPKGTIVDIYESDKLPDGVIKPNTIKIDLTSSNKGWDPTDPDPTNPWK